MKSKEKIGNVIVPAGVIVEKHEIETASLLAKGGGDVSFIIPSSTKKVRSPDVEFEGKIWEMKCPTGGSKWTVEKHFRKASHQSENIVFDARKMKLPTVKVLSMVEHEFLLNKGVKRVKFIFSKEKIIDLKRR